MLVKSKSFSISNTKGIILFIIISLALIVFVFILTADYSQGKTPVEATIVSVERNGKSRHWYAKYTVNGKEYVSSVNGNTDDLSVGKRLTLYYDENNPGKIWHNTEKGRAIFARSIFIGFPAAILILGFITSKTSKKKQQQLEESGELQQYQNPYESTYQNPYENNSGSSNSTNSYNDINKF